MKELRDVFDDVSALVITTRFVALNCSFSLSFEHFQLILHVFTTTRKKKLERFKNKPENGENFFAI